LAKGGEGGGKSVAGIIRDLEFLRVGMSGILVSPDLQHFKKSLWREFRLWCPWEYVSPSQQYRASKEWQPHEAFELAFTNGASLICGGIESPISWEGPNVSFAHLDEARRSPTAGALKVLDGRVRISGPRGEMPQLWLTSTPAMNWLHEYFGPVVEDDPRAAFKKDSLVVSLLTKDNSSNLAPGYVEKRAQSLTEAEVRVLLEAEWEDIDKSERFLPDMTLWDLCRQEIPPLDNRTPMVIALDAGIHSDSFGMVGVTRNPIHKTLVAVRYVQEWRPTNGTISFQGTDDYPGPEMVLRRLCKAHNIVCVTFDEYQLHDMATRLGAEGIAWFRPFPQGSDRLEADKQLFDLILERRLAHDGNSDLRRHINNANKKPDPETRKLRLVKREGSLKIDLAVCASMAANVCLKLDI
jgi:terminase large subunit-like protein